MATSTAVTQANGHVPSSTLPKHVLEYEKILKLRDDVFAGNHPRLKLIKQINEQNTARNAVAASVPSVPSFPLFQQANGSLPHPAASQPPQTNGIAVSAKSLKPSLPAKPPTSVPPSKPTFTTSSIDPVLLTKSDVLVKAEYRQKRQRIERTLEEQIHQRRLIERAAFDQDFASDLDVGEVLLKAHELVKPFKPTFLSDNIATESPSDSFDENTFYSSQMNDTASEEVDGSPQRRPKGARPNEHGKRQQTPITDSDKARVSVQQPSAPITQNRATDFPNPQSRIAQLEEELRRLKAEKEAPTSTTLQSATIVQRTEDEDVPYSPPDVQMPLSATSARRDVGPDRMIDLQEPQHGMNQVRAREYYQRHLHEPSPLPDNMRVVRNHITSPAAPQPSRVSPLAVSKEPRGYSPRQQARRDSGQYNRRPVDSRLVEPEERRNTWQNRGPASESRKRRRGPDSRETTRNVHARRDTVSPEIRIKEEPASPPLNMRVLEPLHGDRRREQRPIYIENDQPSYPDSERIVYLPPRGGRYGAGVSGRATPVSPVAQRVAPNGLPRYQQEPDLRRVVSTRQLRPPSPLDPPYQPRPASSRIVSQPIPPSGMESSRNPGTFVQPRVFTDYGYKRQVSPALSSSDHLRREIEPVPMAPPPRRIVVDQYGNRFMESLDQYQPIESTHSADDHGRRHDRPTVPPIEGRDSILMPPAPPPDRAISPAVSRHEYPAPRTMQVLDRTTGRIVEEREYIPRENRTQSVAYAPPPMREGYEELSGPQDVVRMQSVRPAYDPPYDRSVRVQSLHPEQERFIRQQEVVRPPSRQASVRPEAMINRPSAYTMEDRPRYQFPQEVEERRYVRGGNQRRYVYMDGQDGPR